MSLAYSVHTNRKIEILLLELVNDNPSEEVYW
jgi:hypothetical protein